MSDVFQTHFKTKSFLWNNCNWRRQYAEEKWENGKLEKQVGNDFNIFLSCCGFFCTVKYYVIIKKLKILSD